VPRAEAESLAVDADTGALLDRFDVRATEQDQATSGRSSSASAESVPSAPTPSPEVSALRAGFVDVTLCIGTSRACCLAPSRHVSLAILWSDSHRRGSGLRMVATGARFSAVTATPSSGTAEDASGRTGSI